MMKRNKGRTSDRSKIQMCFPHLVKSFHHQYDEKDLVTLHDEGNQTYVHDEIHWLLME